MRLFIRFLVALGVLMFPMRGPSQIWGPPTTIITGSGGDETNNVQEPNVIYDAGTYKMWITHGWDTPDLDYYTSADGVSWTAYGSNPVKTDVLHPHVFKDGSTYHLYFVPVGTVTRFDHFTSSDGISWSSSATSVISVGAGGTWDDTEMGTMNVWKEGANDWRAIYEARGASDVEPWHLGYATSSDGDTWSKSGSNPVLNETGTTGGPFIYKDGSTYWMWVHRSISGVIPTDISRYSSTNLTSWTRNPVNNTMTRTSIAGNSGSVGQLANVKMLTVGTQTYAWICATPDGSASTGHAVIALYIARLPLAQLVNTSEGY